MGYNANYTHCATHCKPETKKTGDSSNACVCCHRCCNWNVRAACAQSFTLWQQATIEFSSPDEITLLLLVHATHIAYGVVLRAHTVCGEPRIQQNASREVATQVTETFNK